jgi:hypothetical protein
MDLHDYTAAGRLYKFLAFLHSEHDRTPATNSWANYFGLESPANPQFFVCVATLLRLPDEARESVDNFSMRDLARRRLERALPNVEAVLALAPNLVNVAMQEMKVHFDGGTLADLETCSDVLVERFATVGLDETDTEEGETTVDQIRRLGSELALLATESGLPVEVALLLLKNAEAIVNAIDVFKIVGPEGVVREYERFVGAVMTRPEAANEIRKRPKLTEKVVELSKAVVVLGAAFAVPGQVAIETAKFYEAIEPMVKAATGS